MQYNSSAINADWFGELVKKGVDILKQKRPNKVGAGVPAKPTELRNYEDSSHKMEGQFPFPENWILGRRRTMASLSSFNKQCRIA